MSTFRAKVRLIVEEERPQLDSREELVRRIDYLETHRDRLATAIKAIRKELHDGLSQQLVGIAMMASNLTGSLKSTDSRQAEKVEQLAGAMEDAKRQTFALAERLKQIDFELNG